MPCSFASFRVGPGRLMIMITYGLLIVMVKSTTTIMTMIMKSASGQIPMILRCMMLEIDYIIKT